MSDSKPERIAFEAKVAFLERAVELMNGVVQEQGRVLHDLEERFAKLESRIEEQTDSEGSQMRPHDDPPPHY
jgi:uncharacterized coiled-coil protein SlyX